MKINKTKYANMSVNELLSFADANSESLTEVGRELMYRLEELWLHPSESEPCVTEQ